MADEEKGFGWGKDPIPGGFLDDFDGCIVGAIFQEGDYGIQLTLSIKNIDPDWAGENQPAWYSLGSGDHVVLDGGERVGGDMYRENSKVDLLVKSALKVGAKLPPGDAASIWEGLTFHWNRMTMSKVASRIIEIGGKEPEMLVPTKYLGTREVATVEGEVSDTAVSEVFLEILQAAEDAGRGPLKPSGLMIQVMNKYPELKAQVAKTGRTVLAGLVENGMVVMEDGKYKIGIDF